MSTTIQDQARFSEQDCADVVMASFACRVCLAAPELIELAGRPGERIAASHCPRCGTLNRVSMTDAQAFMLWTLQRGNTFVHFPPEHW